MKLQTAHNPEDRSTSCASLKRVPAGRPVGIRIVLALCAAACLLTAQAFAQAFPTKPVRMVASGIGGAGDFTARLIAAGVTTRLGQQVIIDNRPGGTVPGEIVSKAQADGHTLMFAGLVIWLSPFMRENVPFDPVRDFAPITLAVIVPNVLVAHPGVNVKSTAELIALAKQKPGVLNYANSGIGNSNHLAGELFKAMAGIDIVPVNYRGAPLAMNDLLSGRVQLMFATALVAKPHVATGKLTALAVTSGNPSALLPDVPTIAASGLPGYESVSTLGAFAPAATPKGVVSVLHKSIVGVLNEPESKQRLFAGGIEVVASTPEQFAAAIKADMARTGPIIRKAGIRMD
jgi:tripartite-type tricarboxylate transporter receptor subunit TctC